MKKVPPIWGSSGEGWECFLGWLQGSEDQVPAEVKERESSKEWIHTVDNFSFSLPFRPMVLNFLIIKHVIRRNLPYWNLTLYLKLRFGKCLQSTEALDIAFSSY